MQHFHDETRNTTARQKNCTQLEYFQNTQCKAKFHGQYSMLHTFNTFASFHLMKYL